MIVGNDEANGKGKQIKGYIREGVDKLMNNKAEQGKGRLDEVIVQEENGKAKRKPQQ